MSFADELRKTDPNTELIGKANYIVSSFRDECKKAASVGKRQSDNSNRIAFYDRCEWTNERSLGFSNGVNSRSAAVFIVDYVEKTLETDGFTTLNTGIAEGYGSSCYSGFSLYAITISATW